MLDVRIKIKIKPDTYSHNAAKVLTSKEKEGKRAYKAAQLFTGILVTTLYIREWAEATILETKALQPPHSLRGVNFCSLCVNLFLTTTHIKHERPMWRSDTTHAYTHTKHNWLPSWVLSFLAKVTKLLTWPEPEWQNLRAISIPQGGTVFSDFCGFHFFSRTIK